MNIIVWLAIKVLLYGIRIAPTIFNFFFKWFCQIFIAGFVTPKGHRKYGEYHESKAYRDLIAEGYYVQPWFAATSVARIKQG